VERDLEEGEFGEKIGEYGKVVKAVEEKFVCPICSKAWDTQRQAVKKFLENHDVEDLD
jgi:hypothetical protein